MPGGHWGPAPACGDVRCRSQAAGAVLSGAGGSGGDTLSSGSSCPARLVHACGCWRAVGVSGSPSPQPQCPCRTHTVVAWSVAWSVSGHGSRRRWWLGRSPPDKVTVSFLITGPPRAAPGTAVLFWKAGTSLSIPRVTGDSPQPGLECALWTRFKWSAVRARSRGTATQLHRAPGTSVHHGPLRWPSSSHGLCGRGDCGWRCPREASRPEMVHTQV